MKLRKAQIITARWRKYAPKVRLLDPGRPAISFDEAKRVLRDEVVRRMQAGSLSEAAMLRVRSMQWYSGSLENAAMDYVESTISENIIRGVAAAREPIYDTSTPPQPKRDNQWRRMAQL